MEILWNYSVVSRYKWSCSNKNLKRLQDAKFIIFKPRRGDSNRPEQFDISIQILIIKLQKGHTEALEGDGGTSCVTQLKLLILDKLSSTIHCCLFVCLSIHISDTRPNLHFFSLIYIGMKALYWACTTKYQVVPTHTNPVSPSSSQYCHILTQYHQVPTGITL